TLDVGARDHSAGAAALQEVKIDIELARQSPNRGKHLQPFRATWRLDLARRFAALNLPDDCAGIRIGAFTVFNQRGADLDQIALSAESPCDGSAPRGRYLHNGLVGLYRQQRLVGDDVIAFVHQPSHDFSLFETLPEIGQCELARHEIRFKSRKLASRTDGGNDARN